MDISSRTFVCGVGVQKAGTTWLYDYLASRGDIYMSPRKELHFFNNRFRKDLDSKIELEVIRSIKKELTKLESAEFRIYSSRLVRLLDRLRMEYSEAGYSDYFASRIGDEELFGEITPAYCLIGEEGFSYMKSLFPNVKIIYLVRDPIERHFSLLRMMGTAKKDPSFAKTHFIKSLSNKFLREMADYQTHLKGLQSVFSDHELFIGFYETLFSDEEIRRLCSFLDVVFKAGNYEKRQHESARDQHLTDRQIKEARAILDPTYEYCRSNLARLPDSWKLNI